MSDQDAFYAKILVTVLLCLLGLIFLSKATIGIKRGKIHRYLGSGFIGWPTSYTSDLYTRQQDGLLFWFVCLFHLTIGCGLIVAPTWTFWFASK